MRAVLPKLPGEEAEIFNSFVAKLSNISEEQAAITQKSGEPGTSVSPHLLDFSGLRLDWLRLQIYLFIPTSPLNLVDNRRLVEHMHSTIFHTKLVDYLDELLRLVCDLSIFHFYPEIHTDFFNQCLRNPSQLRFAIVFPSLCARFTMACHDLCPEERAIIGQVAVRMAANQCQVLAERVCLYLLARVDKFGELADQLAPQNGVQLLIEDKPTGKKKKHKNKSNYRGHATFLNGLNGGLGGGNTGNSGSQSDSKRVRGVAPGPNGFGVGDLPGSESFRRSREEQTPFDKTLFTLSQLCFTVNHHCELHVFDQVIVPREILQLELQTQLIEVLSKYTTLV
ncbi:unnamed protein product [Protopolystoma xenopodis]|uniref:Uncharacterized protein n=1 Tax=Protopolystoma xenopodis TaxID=117903 RepID=A0A448WSH1_9PLAT|nr:unnamed protein product [Protopolystoma xenopodis]